MKREEFLWPLTQGHHGALVAARNIRNRLAPLNENDREVLLRLNREVSDFFKLDLVEHFFGEEEEVMKMFEIHAGSSDSDILKIRQEHDTLELLSKSLTKTELQLFADTLTAHIRFEEEIFFPRVEAALSNEEKKGLAERLLFYKPDSSHCPLPQ